MTLSLEQRRPLRRTLLVAAQSATAVVLSYLLCGLAEVLVVALPVGLVAYAVAFVYMLRSPIWPEPIRSSWYIALSAPVFFVGSSLFWLVIAPLVGLGLPVLVFAEWKGWVRRLSTVRYLAFSWLAVVTPTFGIMALLLSHRWHRQLPGGNTLGIWLGFSYTAVYELLFPSANLQLEDHPFPPLTSAQLDIIGMAVLGVAVIATYVLFRTGGFGRLLRGL